MMSMEDPYLSIVVPTYKEAKNIEQLLKRIHAAISPQEYTYEVIVVDDRSGDGIENVVKQFYDNGYPVRCHVRMEERGLGSAVIHGFQKARGKILLAMDADLSHPPEKIPELIAPFKKTNPPEFVIGSRFVENSEIDESWKFHRYVNSYVATLMSKPLLFRDVKDPMGGFFSLPKSVFLRGENLQAIGYKIGLELIMKCGCSRIEEIPIRFEDRLHGESKLNLNEQMKYINHLSRLYDFRWPMLSAVIKYAFSNFIGLVIGLVIGLLLTEGLSMTSLMSTYLVAYVAGPLSTSFLFFFRYMIYNRGLIQSKRPLIEFFGISFIEFIAVYFIIARLIGQDSFSLALFTMVSVLGASVRFLGRKVVGHDLRGPSLLRNELETYSYHEEGLHCLSCDHEHFSFPFIYKHPWLLRCKNCHFMFSHPQPNDDELEKIYDEHYFDEWGVQASRSSLRKMKEKTFESIIHRIATIQRVQNVLDVGCGLGYTIDAGQKIGIDVKGVDFNKSAVQQINERHPGKAVHGDLNNLDSKDIFEMITFFDVIEHVRNPVETLETMKLKLKEDGLLTLTTIDAGSRRAKSLGKDWFHIHEAHLWYYTKRSLKNILEKSGFEVLNLKTAEKRFTLRYIFGVLSEKSGNVLLRALARLSIRILPSFALDYVLPPLKEGIEVLARVKSERPEAVEKYLLIEQSS